METIFQALRVSVYLCHVNDTTYTFKKSPAESRAVQSLTYAPVYFVDGVTVDTVSARSPERRRGKHGRVYLHKGEEQQEGPR